MTTNDNITLRVARRTDRLDEVVRFYSQGLGLLVLGSFRDHDGFDGTMLGRTGAAYHLEFTRRQGHSVGRAPTRDNLLVCYLPDSQQWREAIGHADGRLRARASLQPVLGPLRAHLRGSRRLPRRLAERILAVICAPRRIVGDALLRGRNERAGIGVRRKRSSD